MKKMKTIIALILAFAILGVFADDSAPFFLNTAKGTRIAKKTELISYSTDWDKGSSVRVTADGATLKEAVAPASGDVVWDGAKASLGLHTLTHVSGGKTLTAQFTVLGDDIVVHSGVLKSSEIWDTNKVHLVTGAITVPSGVSLTINSGAVVKFMPGMSLTVISGGSCNASGAIFTHVNDDTIGGDTMMDEDSTVPKMGEYTITGNVIDNDATEYRYSPPQTLTSNISSDTRLRGYRTYIVSNSVTVASGAKLTLQPGTVLKFNSGCSLTVNGTLDAQGTRAAPIVFTSIKDDEHGGDTNGDGDKTYPYAGDWYQIRVAGTADFNYCHVLYNSSTENYGGVEAYGGTINFDNSEIAHTKYECVNAHSSGNFTARNSVFRDSSLGFGYYGSGRVKAYNCVFSDLSVAIRQSGKTLVNCVFYRCLAFTDQSGDGSSFSNCVFFNDSGYGAQSYTKCGSNGNIWGDPCFVDAENGDFRISADSPCVDAGNGDFAPETDYYGQPRDDGAPDIGIYEAISPYTDRFDIVPLSVEPSVSSVSPGEKLTVRWSVANRGKLNIEDPRRDAISLFSESGEEISLGESIVTGVIATGGTLEWADTYIMPPVADGVWRIKVNVNAHQDVIEGAARLNNALVSSQKVTVTVPVVAASGANGTVAAGERKIVKIPFALNDTDRMVRISVAPGVTVSWGFGFAPQSVSSASGSAVSGEAGVAFLVPDGANDVYLVIESAVTTEWTLQTNPSRIAVTAVEPSGLPSSGSATITINGAGFTPSSIVSFTGPSNVRASGMTYVSPGRILVTVDCETLTAGAKYGVTVRDGANNASLPFAIAAQPAVPKPNLEFSIETPSTVRRGRVSVGFIEWRNTGNAEALAPIVTLKASKGTIISLSPDGDFAKSVRFVGVGSAAPVGKIMPGDGGRQYFYFMPGSGSYRISYSVLGDGCKIPRDDSVFASWKDFSTGISEAATRMGLAGHATIDFMRLRDLANKTELGFNSAIVSGTLVSDILSRPMVGCTVTLMDASGVAIASTTTGRDGTFAFFDVIKSTGLSVCTEDVDGMRSVSVDTSTGDCLGLEIRSSLRPIVGSVVSAGYDRQIGAKVELLAGGEKIDSTITDSSGEFAFWGVTNNNCALRVQALGICAETSVGIGGETFAKQVVMPYAGCVAGQISFANGGKVPSGLPLMLIAVDGNTNTATYSVSTDDNGRFSFAGLMPGEYLLSSVQRYASSFSEAKVTAEAGRISTLDVLIPSPVPFSPSMPVCFAPGSISFKIDDETVLAAKAFKWDFDGDGTIDSTETTPTVTYSTSGIYDVVLQAQGDDGKWKEYRYPSCVEVRNNVETVLNTNVKALSAKSVLSVSDSSGEIVVDQATGAKCNAGDVLVVPFSDGPSAVKVKSISKTSNGVALKVDTPEVTEVFQSVSLSAAKGSVEGWFTSKLRDVLPELDCSCPYASFDSGNIGSLKLLYLTLTPSLDGHIAMEVSDGKIAYVYAEVALTTMMSFGLDFNAGAEVTPIELSNSVPLANFFAGPVPMTVEASSAISGSLTGGYEGRWEWESSTARRGAYFRFGHNVNPPYVGPISETKESEKTKAAWCSGFNISGHFLGVDLAAGFNAKAAKAKALAIGIQLGGDVTYKKSWNNEFEPDEGNVTVGFGLDFTFTPFEVELWKVGPLGGNFKVAPQSLSLVRLEDSTKPSLSAIPKIVSASVDDTGNARITTDVEWNDSDKCGYKETIDWGDGTKTDGLYVHKYETRGLTDRVEMRVVVTQDYDDLFTRQKRAAQVLVLNPVKCKCGPDCVECDGHCEDCQCGSGGDGGESGSSGGKEVVSWDPNEMVGEDGVGNARYVKPGQELTYTIFFENKTNATAAAQEIRVTNLLPEWLDWSTFKMQEVAFNNQTDYGLFGLANGVSEFHVPGTNYNVRTEVKLDTTTGETTWYLRIVDPANLSGWPMEATAGFLPPNNPETHCGEGHLTYRIKLRDDAPGNVVITNSATIVFDYNEPITTDPAWWNTVAPTVGEARFVEDAITTEEGSNIVLRVFGGNAYSASSTKLYLTYNTAAAADVDLKNGTVDSSTGGSPVPNAQAARSTNLKFPLTLTWAAGEIGEKTITIPVLADKAVEDAERFTLQLGDPVGMELGETRLCTVTITDPGYAELEAKIAAGTATKAEKTAWDKLQKAKAPYIRGVADPANAGKVTGSGFCASGKKVTLKATANKGYVFTGWLKSQIALDGDRLVTNAVEYVATTPSLVIDRTAKPAKDTATSTTLTNVNENATFYAAFITTDEDKAAVGLTLNGGEVPQVEDNAPSLVTNIMCGVALNWPLASSALSATTVKVAGLPAGLKFTAKDIMKKGSKTEVEIPANTIYGAPTAASKIDKKTGLPVPSAVKVTVTTAGKSSVTYLMNITVDALPAWAVGNFEGFVRYDENDGGLATMSITAAGKVSGKIAYGGTNWTFKADSFAIASETVGYTNLAIRTVATSGKATLDLSLNMVDFLVDSLPSSTTSFAEGYFGEVYTMMHRLPWKDKGDADAAALIASYAGAYSCREPYGDDSGDVTFVLDEKGAVKGTVVLPDGDKTRKATFSCNVLPNYDSLSVVIALPPDAKKGYPAVFKVVNLVNHSGEGADNLAFRDPGVVASVAELTAESGATGTVSVNPKYGQVAPGKDVTLTAKAAKGSVFHRWEITGVDTEGLDLSSATLKFKMTDAGDVFATALFATTQEDAASLALDLADAITETDGAFLLDLGACVSSLSLAKLTVAGLPTGLKYDAKTMTISGKATKPGLYAVKVTATNASATGKNAVVGQFTIEVPNFTAANGYFVDNLDNGVGKKRVLSVGITNIDDFLPSLALNSETAKLAVSGLPAGLKYDAKTGKITGVATKPGTYTVTLTVTDGKAKYVSTITVEVEALPDWVVGTFEGYAFVEMEDESDYHDRIIYTISSTGKVSSKGQVEDTTWYTIKDNILTKNVDGSYQITSSEYEWDFEEKRTIRIKSNVVDGVVIGYLSGIIEGAQYEEWSNSWINSYGNMDACQNVWKNAQGTKLAPAFAKNVSTVVDMSEMRDDDWDPYYGGYLTLKYGANGAVTTAYSESEGGKATATGSAQLVPYEVDGNITKAWLYTALKPKGRDPFGVLLLLSINTSKGNVYGDDVVVEDYLLEVDE